MSSTAWGLRRCQGPALGTGHAVPRRRTGSGRVRWNVVVTYGDVPLQAADIAPVFGASGSP
ncbi:hypothetical protein [Brevundimonas aurantiaca]|uniref:hypothetical protein n=1 Tax=Brevundimonas aurantiaca TaxID=74316 RepID=UPI001CD69984|nr:hypothetical protein [Brevundimonas aurantiaca]